MPAEQQGLTRIVRARRLIWLWPLTFIPVLLAAVWMTPHAFAAVVVAAAVWTVGLAVSISRTNAILCPRCGSRFHGNRIMPNARACVSCGLPLKQRHVVYPTLE